jgi:hypothetical protein
MSARPRQRFDLNWVLVVVLTVFAVAPLTYPGGFEVQSGFLSAYNVEHLSAAPNWGRMPDLVRGEGKLPYLLAWPFFKLTGSGIAAIHWGYALTFVLGALGTYVWTRRWLGSRGGVLAATVYTYLPWHLSTVFVRGAHAEAWLWVFWPFLLWSIDRLGDGSLRGTFIAFVTGLPLLAATFWTQPGLAVLALPLLLAYGVMVPVERPWPLLHLAEAEGLLLLFLALTTRWLVEPAPFSYEGFLHPFQLASATWGDGLPFQLGVVAVGLSIVAVALSVTRRSGGEQREQGVAAPGSQGSMAAISLDRALWFWLGSLLVLILLNLSWSAPLWRLSGLDAWLTAPWQLLSLAGLPLAFLAGAVVRLEARLATLPAWAGLVALVVLASYPYLVPRFTQIDPGSEPVAAFQPVGADAPQLMILDYEVEPPSAITPTLGLTLTWQAVEPVAGDYTVFVHVLGEGDVRAAQKDTRPCDGECPTDSWRPGEIMVDRYELALAPDAPPGPYELAVGLYLLDSGERAAVMGREDGTVYLDVPYWRGR